MHALNEAMWPGDGKLTAGGAKLTEDSGKSSYRGPATTTSGGSAESGNPAGWSRDWR